MTVTYSLNVAQARLAGFAKLLIRWKGSIYKLLYREMLIFCGIYYSLSFLYRYVLNPDQKLIFETAASYCESFTNVIPLSFVLGFYVSIVVGRWWSQFQAIPWPDKAIMLIAGHVHGSDERGRIMRRTLARYLLLMQALTFQAVSTSVRKRFPTLDHLEEAGIMSKEERIAYDDIPCPHGKWWVPAQWFTALVNRARKEGRIKDDILMFQILEELHVYRGLCGLLFAYDWISVPLVYTQVVTLATYMYFLATVMGRQYLDPEKGFTRHEVDVYFPVFTIMEFFFYMGWLKVAEVLINPFGEDDDDYELNWCLDRNLVVSFWVVDQMYQKHPRLVRDMYYDEQEPVLPYTRQSVKLRTQPHLGSAMRLDLDEDAEFVPMETIMEEDNDENNYNSPAVSPTNELLSPGFAKETAAANGEATRFLTVEGMDQKSTIGAKDPERGSQLGLQFLPNFPGARLLNMIIGSSSENVSRGDTPASRLKLNTAHAESGQAGNVHAPFLLKTPHRRNRTTSVSAADTAGLRGAGSTAHMTGNPQVPLDASIEVPQTAPIPPFMRGTPLTARREFGDERKSMVVDSGFAGSHGAGLRPASVNERGFIFPKPPTSSASNQSQEGQQRTQPQHNFGPQEKHHSSIASSMASVISASAGSIVHQPTSSQQIHSQHQQQLASQSQASEMHMLGGDSVSLSGIKSPERHSSFTHHRHHLDLNPALPSASTSDIRITTTNPTPTFDLQRHRHQQQQQQQHLQHRQSADSAGLQIEESSLINQHHHQPSPSKSVSRVSSSPATVHPMTGSEIGPDDGGGGPGDERQSEVGSVASSQAASGSVAGTSEQQEAPEAETQSAKSSDSDERIDPYEPTSSQESLEPYVESNQSTVTSLSELIRHQKERERKQH